MIPRLNANQRRKHLVFRLRKSVGLFVLVRILVAPLWRVYFVRHGRHYALLGTAVLRRWATRVPLGTLVLPLVFARKRPPPFEPMVAPPQPVLRRVPRRTLFRLVVVNGLQRPHPLVVAPRRLRVVQRVVVKRGGLKQPLARPLVARVAVRAVATRLVPPLAQQPLDG